MKNASVSLLLVVLLLNSACAYAQTNVTRTPENFVTSYDAYIRRTMERLPEIPGIAIVVIKDDKPIFLKAYGMADRERGIKADTDTLFYIASSTKSFTALAASMLDQEGKIKFSEPVTKYAPGVKFKNELPAKITVRDLLTHERSEKRSTNKSSRLYGADRTA
jgi:CubicO group peptidase (beta-lactamase class C family)